MLICGYNVSLELIQIATKLIQVVTNFAVIAGVIFALWQYKISLFSQKFSNAQILVNSFYNSLKEGDIQAFKDIIMLRGESAGGDNNGHYLTGDGELEDFSVYFVEGSPDDGAFNRIVSNLDRVCYFAVKDNINLKFFYSELGQFINISHEVLKAIPSGGFRGQTLLSSFVNIKYCFNDLNKNNSSVPIKIIGYIE